MKKEKKKRQPQPSSDLSRPGVEQFLLQAVRFKKGLAATVLPNMGRGEQNCRNARGPDSLTELHLKGRLRFQMMNGGERKPSQHPSFVALENYYFGA